METLVQDIRVGTRLLRKNWTFACIAILTLGLGIGANSAVFTVIKASLLQPLPYPDSERLVFVNEGNRYASTSYPNFLDWQQQGHVFQKLGATQQAIVTLTQLDGPKLIPAAFVSGDFLEILGVRPLLGRYIVSADDTPSAAPVAVLSYRLWQRLGGDAGIIGSSIQLDQASYRVIGVMPADFRYVLDYDPEVLIPVGLLAQTPEKLDRAKHDGLIAIGRLKPGISLSEAQAEMDIISARLAKTYPDIDYPQQCAIAYLYDVTVADIKLRLAILLAAVALVLLIACSNVANLLLARLASRTSEIAIRVSVGASRTRLIRQMLTESVLLALLGGVLGVAFAFLGVRLLVVYGGITARTETIHVDSGVLMFTFLISIITGMVFGTVPALYAAGFRGSLLKASSKAISAGHQRFKNSLVILQLALSFVLLVVGGLLFHSFMNLLRAAPGFEPDNLLTAEIHLSQDKYKTQPQLDSFFDLLTEKLNQVAGNESVAVTRPLPFSGEAWGYGFLVEGEPFPAPNEIKYTRLHYITPGYFRTLKIPLLRGRDIDANDNDSGPPVAIVSQSFAHYWLHDKSPIGTRVRLGKARDLASPDNPWFTIVGVVNDIRNYGGEWIRGELYVPFDQHQRYHVALTTRYITIRNKNLTVAAQQLRAAIAGLDNSQPVGQLTTMDDLIVRSMSSHRALTIFIGVFASIALLLTAIGIYGLMSYWVNQRVREIGVRLALGATQQKITMLVLKQGVRLALWSFLAGIPLTFWALSALHVALYGIGRYDPVTIGSIVILVSLVAALSSYVPARRAARTDPLIALKQE